MTTQSTLLGFDQVEELQFAAELAARRVLDQFGFVYDGNAKLMIRVESPEAFEIMILFRAPNLDQFYFVFSIDLRWPDPCIFAHVVQSAIVTGMMLHVPPGTRIDRYLRGELEN